MPLKLLSLLPGLRKPLGALGIARCPPWVGQEEWPLLSEAMFSELGEKRFCRHPSCDGAQGLGACGAGREAAVQTPQGWPFPQGLDSPADRPQGWVGAQFGLWGAWSWGSDARVGRSCLGWAGGPETLSRL